jgi:hypothetical protein
MIRAGIWNASVKHGNRWHGVLFAFLWLVATGCLTGTGAGLPAYQYQQ